MNIQIGQTYTFDYPIDFSTLPAYTGHRGQEVTVVGIVEDGDPEMEPTFAIRAADGWEGVAFESELCCTEEAISAGATAH